MTDDAGRQVVSGEVNVPQGCREIQPCLSPIEIFPTQRCRPQNPVEPEAVVCCGFVLFEPMTEFFNKIVGFVEVVSYVCINIIVKQWYCNGEDKGKIDPE